MIDEEVFDVVVDSDNLIFLSKGSGNLVSCMISSAISVSSASLKVSCSCDIVGNEGLSIGSLTSLNSSRIRV